MPCDYRRLARCRSSLPENPVMGLIEQISSGSPSTLRTVRRRPSPPDLASLSIAVLQRSLFLGITRLGPGFRINCLVYDN